MEGKIGNSGWTSINRKGKRGFATSLSNSLQEDLWSGRYSKGAFNYISYLTVVRSRPTALQTGSGRPNKQSLSVDGTMRLPGIDSSGN